MSGAWGQDIKDLCDCVWLSTLTTLLRRHDRKCITIVPIHHADNQTILTRRKRSYVSTFMTSPSLLFTSESVTEGHPDKMCDQISDAVLDAIFAQDPMSRVACETAIKTGFVMVLGEITTTAFVNFDELIRKVVKEIGFDASEKGFDGNTCGVQVAIASQSPDIAMGVDRRWRVQRRRWMQKSMRSKRSALATRA